MSLQDLEADVEQTYADDRVSRGAYLCATDMIVLLEQDLEHGGYER